MRFDGLPPRWLTAALAALWLATAPAARAADPLVLQLKWVPQAQFAGYFVADAKGFYRQAGLAVTLKPGGPDIDPAKVLAEGGADIAIDWLPSALAAREQGAPIVNIAQFFQRSGMEMTCRRDSGVRRPADLKGRTLGVWYAGNEYPFLAWMAKLGLRTSGDKPDVNIVQQGAGVELLTEGKAACISTMSYNEYWQVVDAGIRPAQLVVFRYEDQGVATLEDGLYARAEKLADPAMLDRLARFLRASAAGWRYAIDPAHRTETVDIVLGGRTGDDVARRSAERMLGEIAKLIPDSRHALGYLDPAAYERSVGVLLAEASKPVIARRPEGAWTHAVWERAFAR